MAELLQRQKTPLVTFKKGDAIKGRVTKLTSSEILLDINTKTEAVVMENDRKIMKQLLSLLKVGDEVMVSVLNPESDMGHTVVSLRRFADDILWKKLTQIQKNQEKVDVIVRESTKGGFLVETPEGTNGFLPNSHVAQSQKQHELLGQKIKVLIVELNRDAKKIIFSQKAVLGNEDFKKAVVSLKKGQKVTATVTNITQFGMFVSLPLVGDTDIVVDGLIHISEISWVKLEEIGSKFAVGDVVEAVVIGFDENGKRVDLSIKRLTNDPFEETAKQFTLEQKISGIVKKIDDKGLLIDLGKIGDQDVEGIIRKDKIPPTMKFTEGQKIEATVSQIDSKKRKIILVPVLKEKPIGYR